MRQARNKNDDLFGLFFFIVCWIKLNNNFVNYVKEKHTYTHCAHIKMVNVATKFQSNIDFRVKFIHHPIFPMNFNCICDLFIRLFPSAKLVVAYLFLIDLVYLNRKLKQKKKNTDCNDLCWKRKKLFRFFLQKEIFTYMDSLEPWNGIRKVSRRKILQLKPNRRWPSNDLFVDQIVDRLRLAGSYPVQSWHLHLEQK